MVMVAVAEVGSCGSAGVVGYSWVDAGLVEAGVANHSARVGSLGQLRSRQGTHLLAAVVLWHDPPSALSPAGESASDGL